MSTSSHIDDDFEIIEVPAKPSNKAATTAKATATATGKPAVKKPAPQGDDFAQLLRVMQSTVDAHARHDKPLFRVALPSENTLFNLLLNNLPVALRQEYTCTTCRRFFDVFANLCYVDEDDGQLVPLMWPEDVSGIPQRYHDFVKAIRAWLVDKKVDKDYQILSEEDKKIGSATSGDPIYTHFHVVLKDAPVITDTSGILDLDTATAVLNRILSDNQKNVVDVTHNLLHEKLPHATTHKPSIDWLQKVVHHFDRLNLSMNSNARHNLVAFYARSAWAGLLSSLRSGIIGELLSWVREAKAAKKFNYGDIESKWIALANPTNYLRPTAAPSVGNIQAAEKSLKDLGYTKEDLQRYFLATDELPEPAILWRNNKLWAKPVEDTPEGIFSQLKIKAESAPGSKKATDAPPRTTISFRNFVRRVVPGAVSMEILLNQKETMSFFTRGAPGTKSPFVFDSVKETNTMSWYYWNPALDVSQANLKPGWNKLKGIVTFPHMWDYLTPQQAIDLEEEDVKNWKHSRHGSRFLFCIEGAHEKGPQELCLFATLLKNHFHAVRKTIEAYSSEGRISWPHQASDGKAQVGGMARGKDDWSGITLAVINKTGIRSEYNITLFD